MTRDDQLAALNKSILRDLPDILTPGWGMPGQGWKN